MSFYHQILFGALSFVFGTIVGSFLNVVIHRLPRGMSVNEPRRSFCPSCGKQIPWAYNLPIMSWLWLRGKCKWCAAPIPPRYILVEFLTGLLFLGIWVHVFPAWDVAVAYWILAALLIAATFIDFEHFIIPDEITWGGAVVGVIASMLVPALHGQTVWWLAGLWSLAGAATGYGILWLVVQAGKAAFGRYKVQAAQPEEFVFRREENDWFLKVGDEELRASEVFSRETDELVIEAAEASLNDAALEPGAIRLRYNSLRVGERSMPLEEVTQLRGRTAELTIPREAMGFGDVKFIACIGAFLGWQAVAFTVVAASIIGAIVGVILIAIYGREKGGIIPFGPYLALGALLWVFCGPQIVSAYFDWVAGPTVY